MFTLLFQSQCQKRVENSSGCEPVERYMHHNHNDVQRAFVARCFPSPLFPVISQLMLQKHCFILSHYISPKGELKGAVSLIDW